MTVIVKVLAGVMALALVQGAPGTSFCERMAPQIGMTPIERGRQGQTTGEWRRETVTLGAALAGGSVGTSISVRPVGDDITLAQAEAMIDKACTSTKAGVRCRIEGPARVKLGTRKGEIDLTAQPGERAEVEIRGTKVICRDPRAFGDV